MFHSYKGVRSVVFVLLMTIKVVYSILKTCINTTILLHVSMANNNYHMHCMWSVHLVAKRLPCEFHHKIQTVQEFRHVRSILTTKDITAVTIFDFIFVPTSTCWCRNIVCLHRTGVLHHNLVLPCMGTFICNAWIWTRHCVPQRRSPDQSWGHRVPPDHYISNHLCPWQCTWAAAE